MYISLKNVLACHQISNSVISFQGCSRPGFDVIREIDMCVQIYHTTNVSYTHVMDVCRQEGAELISLDNDLKMNTLSSYLLLQCMHYTILYISLNKFLNFLNFNLLNNKRILFFCTVGKAVAVSVGLDNSSGWKWVNGRPLAIGHLNVTNMINNHDGYKDPCDSNYCGIFSVGISKDLKIYDNCCNNINPYFVCSIPFKH